MRSPTQVQMIPGWAAAIAVAGLAGCAVGPDVAPAPRPAPAAFSETGAPGATAGAPSPDLAFWAEIGDPLLVRLVERGLGESQDIAMATARIREARALAGVARSALLPEIDAGGRYDRTRVSTESPELENIDVEQFPGFDEYAQSFRGSLTIAYEVDIWGKHRRAYQAAVADLFAEVERRRAASLVLAGDIAATYLEWRTLARRRAIAVDSLAAREDSLELARAREAAGLGTDLDVARAEAEVASAAASIPDLDRLAALAEHRLSILVGAPPGSLRAELAAAETAPLAPFPVPVGLPADLVTRRPDVRSAALRLAAATARIGQAKADLFPQVTLFGEIGAHASDLGEIATKAAGFFAFGPSIRIPLFDAGRRLDAWTAAEERADAALHELERSILVALGEVEDALATLREESRRREKLALGVRAGERAALLARERYTAGIVSFLDVLEADRTRLAADDALAESDRRLALASVQLARAVAGGYAAADRLLPPVDRPGDSLGPGAFAGSR